MLDWYLAHAASGAGARAAMPSRARARRSWWSVDGDYENVVGLPLATLLDLYPELLRRRQAADAFRLQIRWQRVARAAVVVR